MLGKKMEGSGLTDLLIEAELMSSGSLTGVLSGKHYERALHCHKVLLESLEHLLFEQYLADKDQNDIFENVPEESRQILSDLKHSPSKENLQKVTEDVSLNEYIDHYMKYRDNVGNGSLGKTATYWMTYMNHVWLILELILAVKVNDYALYMNCFHSMPDIFFSFGGRNYARYLTYESVFLANIEESHPGATDLLERGAISVARSFIPGNRCAVDKTMEETS